MKLEIVIILIMVFILFLKYRDTFQSPQNNLEEIIQNVIKIKKQLSGVKGYNKLKNISNNSVRDNVLKLKDLLKYFSV